jgi:hypothetical protein
VRLLWLVVGVMRKAWRTGRRRDAARHVALAHVHIRLRLIHADTSSAVVVVSRDGNGLDAVSTVDRGVVGRRCLESGTVCAVEGRCVWEGRVGAANGFSRSDGASSWRRSDRGKGLQL